MKGKSNKFELMAPVGSYESLMAAINSGANSVYFGIEQLNMRARSAKNFTIDDLKKIAEICNENGVRSYLTLNTIMYDHDINLLKEICNAAKESEVSAIIANDIAAIQYANSIGLEVHISTQSNITNIETVKFYSQFADVMVLSRELTLKQIKHICDKIREEGITGPSGNIVEIEIFAHGALCVAVSGKCYMSLATYNSSANRGACLQNCRRSYKVTDLETGDELKIDSEYIMSPKDLCTIDFIDQVLDTGVTVLKIEGRGRSPDYVYTVISQYRKAIDAYQNGEYTQEFGKSLIAELETVFNRGFWSGYYLGQRLGEFNDVYGSKATKKKVYLGRIENYYKNSKIAQVKLESGVLKVGDEILITGTTTGVVKSKIEEAEVNDVKGTHAKKGDVVTFPLKELVREGDKFFVLVPSEHTKK